jgi:tetratricopeptide (TPR) repeat protein
MTRAESPAVRLARWLPLAVAAGAILAYANSFSGAFLFDDSVVALDNPHIYHLWPPWKAVLQPTRPLADLTFALNYAISGFNPADYHATNLLIHLAAALFLCGIVARTLRMPYFQGRFEAEAPWLATAVALLWAVHPLQTESVTYIAQRNESLMGLFYLATFYLFVRGLTVARPRAWLDAAIAGSALSMGTKEVAITLPFVCLVYDWVFSVAPLSELARRRWKFYVALFLTLAFFGLLFLLSLAKHVAQGGLVYQGLTPRLYALTQFQAVLHYLRLTAFPHPLCLDYMWPPAESLRAVIGPAVLIGALGLATLAGLVRRRAYGFAGAAFFVILAPTSSILPLPDLVFEHRMYVPLAAVLAAAVIGGYRLVARRPGGRAARIGFGAGVVLCAAALAAGTALRNRDYRSEEAMWRDVLRKRPDNYRAYIGLSSSMINRGRHQEAVDICRELLQRVPDFAAMSPADIAQRSAGNLDVRWKKYFYGLAQSNYGAALVMLGRVADAVAHYEAALRLMPESTVARNNLAFACYRQGRRADAIRQWQTTLRWAPNDVTAHDMLAIVLTEEGDYRGALSHYRAVLRINPGHVFAQFRLAWLLATAAQADIRDGAEALRLAQAVERATAGRSVCVMDVMGAAYASLGDFTNAVRYADAALRRAAEAPAANTPPAPGGQSRAAVADPAQTENWDQTPDVADIAARRALYLDHRPYLEAPAQK